MKQPRPWNCWKRPASAGGLLARGVLRRRGAITLELLLNLPLWLMAVWAVIEFGQMAANVQLVALAAREGAREAARTAALPPRGDVPDAIVDAIEHQLESSGIHASRILLEHNTGGSAVLLARGHGAGDPPQMPPPEVGHWVRVTVFTRVSHLTPNLLRLVGLDLSQRWLGQSATYRYEIDTTGVP